VPRLSVIIPIYNRQALGERAIASVLAQKLDDIEVVVVDDCSQPAFRLPPALNAEDNIRVIRHSKNRGAAAARNSGIESAHAPWLAFLDSDDYWLPDSLPARLEWAERGFAECPAALVAYAAGFTLVAKDTGRRDTRIPRPSDNALVFASGCWSSPGSTLILRKDVFARIGPFDASLPRLEDIDWFLRFGLAGGRLEVWPHSVAIIETGPKPHRATVEEAVRCLRRKYTDGGAPQQLRPPLRRRLLASLDLELASASAGHRQFVAAAVYLARSWLRVPRLSLHLERFWTRPTTLGA